MKITFKKGTNLCLVEHQKMDFISEGDLIAPLKRETGKTCQGEVIGLLKATAEFTVDVDENTYVVDSSKVVGFHISGSRPKDITKR